MGEMIRGNTRGASKSDEDRKCGYAGAIAVRVAWAIALVVPRTSPIVH